MSSPILYLRYWFNRLAIITWVRQIKNKYVRRKLCYLKFIISHLSHSHFSIKHTCKSKALSTVLSHMTRCAGSNWWIWHRLDRYSPRPRSNSDVDAWITVFRLPQIPPLQPNPSLFSLNINAEKHFKYLSYLSYKNTLYLSLFF